jgi:DNA-binding LacI/PurR family transcriptional regulator
VEMLLELLAGRDPEQNRILLEPNLIVRQSTAGL